MLMIDKSFTGSKLILLPPGKVNRPHLYTQTCCHGRARACVHTHTHTVALFPTLFLLSFPFLFFFSILPGPLDDITTYLGQWGTLRSLPEPVIVLALFTHDWQSVQMGQWGVHGGGSGGEEVCVRGVRVEKNETWDEGKQIFSSGLRVWKGWGGGDQGLLSYELRLDDDISAWTNRPRLTEEAGASIRPAPIIIHPLFLSLLSGVLSGFINCFGWQIDLLLRSLCVRVCVCTAPPGNLSACLCTHACECECEGAYVNVSAWGDVASHDCLCVVCFERHHPPSVLGVQGPHGGTANVTGQASRCQVPPRWRQAKSPLLPLPHKQVPLFEPPTPPDPFGRGVAVVIKIRRSRN